MEPGGTGEARGKKRCTEAPPEYKEELLHCVRVTTHRHRVPREVADSPSPEISQSRLCHVLWDEKGGGTGEGDPFRPDPSSV